MDKKLLAAIHDLNALGAYSLTPGQFARFMIRERHAVLREANESTSKAFKEQHG